MDKKPKKPSTYDMLKRLDKKVQQNKIPRKEDSYSRNFGGYRKRRSPSPRNQESRKRRSESPFRQDNNRRPSKQIPEIVIDDTDYDVPDRSFGDLYCKACDSHMNSEQMWEAHIQGKRHLKNIKKGGGDQGELKYEILDDDPLLLPEIKKSTEPIIGLQHCCEIRRIEGKPTYQCFLCSANVPNGPSLIEHVIGLKHRMAYLKEHDPVKHDLIDKTNLKKGMIDSVVAECIRLHQDKHGTGIMQVKLDRNKPAVTSNQHYKKGSQDNFDNTMKREDRFDNTMKREDRFDNTMKREDRYDNTMKREDRFDNTMKREDRRNHYPDERNEDYRYTSNKQQDYMRPHYSDDSYQERYSYSSDRGRFPEPPHRGESPVNRRSPIAYEHGHYPITSNQPSNTSWLSQVADSPKNEDLRSVLEQRRVQERAQSNSSNSNLNLFQSLLKIIETMPSMMFLELVLHRVENMNPTEAELTMLQKIGNHMISIVMNQKLQKLSPDLLGKYQNNAKSECSSTLEQNNKSTNNLSSLMNLVSQFNNSKTSSSSVNWGNQDSQSFEPGANVPTFMTQTPGSFYNSWDSSSSAVTEIPGLTLSSTQDTMAYSQRAYEAELPSRSVPSSWSETSSRNTHDRF